MRRGTQVVLLVAAVLVASSTAFPSCEYLDTFNNFFIYATDDGTDAGTGNGTNPISIAAAFNWSMSCATASNPVTIRLATGLYDIDNHLDLPSYTTVDGGYSYTSTDWKKVTTYTPLPALDSGSGHSCIRRSGANPIGPGHGKHVVAIEATDATEFHLRDLTIAITETLTTQGASAYGVHMTGCSSYSLTRVRIDLSGGAAGKDGGTGADGKLGQDGNNGEDGSADGECSAGEGGRGARGGKDYDSGNTYGAGGANTGSETGSCCCSNNGYDGPDGDDSTHYSAGGGGGSGGSGGQAAGDGGDGGKGGGVTGAFGSNNDFGVGGTNDGCTKGNAQSGNGPGADGSDGIDGSGGADGPVGYHAVAGENEGYYQPGDQASQASDGSGAQGGTGGGAGSGQGGAGCNDGAGSGGGGGGGGGGGAEGGKGGRGGGGSFCVYAYNNLAGGVITDCLFSTGAAGLGGVGGAGGLGGSGGSGGSGSTYTGGGEVGRGRGGGDGGIGGNGGVGGDGADGTVDTVHTEGSAISVNTVSFAFYDFAVRVRLPNACTGLEIWYKRTAGNDPCGSDGNCDWDMYGGNPAFDSSTTNGNGKTVYDNVGVFDLELEGTYYFTDLFAVPTQAQDPPVLVLNGDSGTSTFNMCANRSLTFSTPDEGYKYHWDFGIFGPADSYSATPPSFFVENPGSYNIILESTWDSCGTVSNQRTIDVGPIDCDAVCGNGIKTSSEECDDGNTNNGDGCSSTCTIENGWSCAGKTPSVCSRLSCGPLVQSIPNGYMQCNNTGELYEDVCKFFCNSGFYLTGNGERTCTAGQAWSGSGDAACVNINDCSPDPCNGSPCTDLVNNYTCNCTDSGFRGYNCDIDINECAEGTDNCATNTSICINNYGGYSCSCITGYSGTGQVCDDINECGSGTDNCHPDAVCTNTPGSFDCACDSGYSGNGINCTDIDECAGTPGCSGFATCHNTQGAYYCQCISGYDGNGFNCSTVCGDGIVAGAEVCDDSNSNNGDGCSSDCLVIEPNWNCPPAGGACSAANCSEFCFSCIPGYPNNCTNCTEAFTGSPLCHTDVNECSTGLHNCAPTASCDNSYGGFNCTCDPGYQGDGVICSNINECGTGQDNCHADATCADTIGSFTCTCDIGYTGDGVSCSDIDECSNGTLNNCAAEATCSNTAGSFSCSCNAGYSGSGVVCADINECATAQDNCSPIAACTNNLGSYTCTCPSGYSTVNGGINCNNVDECTLETDNCAAPPAAVCSDTTGSFTCNCGTGFVGDGLTCNTVCNDSIVAGAETCDDGNNINGDGCSANCTIEANWSCPTPGSACIPDPCQGNCATCVPGQPLTCTTCSAGWAGLPGCGSDVNECVNGTDDCTTKEYCVNTVGSFTCVCRTGYSFDGDICVDVNECDTFEDCPPNSDCTNSVGSFVCECDDGYESDGMGNCTDINECSPNPCLHNGTCSEPMIDSFDCYCFGGWTGLVCQTDIQECVTLQPCVHGTCSEPELNGYECDCNNGWSGTNCDIPVNPCTDYIPFPCGNGQCDYLGPGNYSCECNVGYRGANCTIQCPTGYMGPTCATDINECSLGLDNCAADAACTNTLGSFTCACPAGFTGDGLICDDIDECTLGTDNCAGNAACNNTVGSFTCTCPAGYTTTDGGVNCDDINECTGDPCENDGICTNEPGGYSCECASGWSGDNCDVASSETTAGSGAALSSRCSSQTDCGSCLDVNGCGYCATTGKCKVEGDTCGSDGSDGEVAELTCAGQLKWWEFIIGGGAGLFILLLCCLIVAFMWGRASKKGDRLEDDEDMSHFDSPVQFVAPATPLPLSLEEAPVKEDFVNPIFDSQDGSVGPDGQAWDAGWSQAMGTVQMKAMQTNYVADDDIETYETYEAGFDQAPVAAPGVMHSIYTPSITDNDTVVSTSPGATVGAPVGAVPVDVNVPTERNPNALAPPEMRHSSSKDKLLDVDVELSD